MAIQMPNGTIVFMPANAAHLHDSDYFSGFCACDDYPCEYSLTAQKWLEARDRRRSKLMKIYHAHHGTWPQSVFIDEIIVAEDE